MKNFIDMTGKTYNDLTALRLCSLDDPKRPLRTKYRTLWWCQCVCGVLKICDGYYVRKGDINSCGCKISEHKRLGKLKEPGASGFYQMYLGYKNAAKEKGNEWSLSQEQVKHITKLNCHYCNKQPSNVALNHGSKFLASREHSKYTYSGIDRKDNTKGYTLENVVPACKECNLMKKAMSYDYFLELISKIFINRCK